jgi:hypothetical protein
MPKAEFKRAVERHLTGQESEPSEILYFKIYKSQLPVIEQALEMAGRMLGSDHSRSYCLEMICADFLAGATLEAEQSEGALLALGRMYSLLPDPQKVKFTESLRKAS